MSDDTHLPRVYGDKEIGRILKRATDLQHAEPSMPTRGVTLTELEEIAAEAGIDPVYLRRAAMDMDAEAVDPTFWSEVAGADLTLLRDVTLSGELSDDGFERIAAAVQTHSRLHGQPSVLGRTLTWRAETPNKTRTIQLVVTSRDGVTQVRLEENLNQLAAGVFGGLVGGGGLGFGIGFGLPIGLEVLGSALFAVAAPIGVVGLMYIGSRAIYRAVVSHRRRALNRLFERAVDAARQSISVGDRERAERSLPSGG